ncbi:hypothetical protein BGX23_009267 [Mortierella sp. AD031]|nr:hypothetical protein BGX23_009267 [Mortierella sp. AD031]
MELMKENQPPAVNAGWSNDGLDLLVKAAQKSSQPKKSKAPSMVLNGSYDTPVIVGRGSQATLNLGRINKQVSRRHAIVQWCAEASTFEITVLGQNGVRINGTGFPSGQQATLRGGDIVDLVGVKMLFRTPTTAPPPPPPMAQQEYQDDDSSQDGGLDNYDEDQVYADPIGLITPKRAQHSTIHQLATPNTSSPARDPMSAPSQLTPTARMRHKMLKYDLSSSPIRNNVYQTPPSTTDAGNDYSSSPVKAPPVFAIPFDAMPNRSPNASLPSSPSSEPNFFMDDSAASSPFRVPNQRAPLAPLALTENSSVKVAKSSFQESTQRTASSGSPQSKPLKNSNSNSTNVKPASAKSGVKDIENIAPIAKESTQKTSKPKEKENHSAKTEVKAKAPLSPSVLTQSSKVKENTARPAKSGQETATKSTASTTTAVKTPKAKTAPKEKAVPEKVTPVVVKELPINQDSHSSSSRESSPDAPATTDKEPRDYTEMIIDTLVFARKKKSMTLTELFDEMITSQPSLMATHDAEEIKEQMLQCLSAARCVGKITRKGKDAYNKPLENQWYYIPECDHNVMRKLTRQEVMPSARKCTLKDKQYFFKMPPKLPYHRKSTSPYAVKPSARRTKEPSKLSAADDDVENGDGSSSSSSSDLDDDVDDQPLSTILNRKRKSAIAGHTDKKRKATNAPSSTTTTAAGSKHTAGSDEDEEEDEDDAHNDSLDDLSELSGLSD